MPIALIQYRPRDLDCDDPEKPLLAMLPPAIAGELYDDSANYFHVVSVLAAKRDIVSVLDEIFCRHPNPLCDREHIIYASDDELGMLEWVSPSLAVLDYLDFDLTVSEGHAGNFFCNLLNDIIHPVTLKRKTFLTNGMTKILSREFRHCYYVMTRQVKDFLDANGIRGLQYFDTALNRRLQKMLPEDQRPVLAKAAADVFEYSEKISSLNFICENHSLIGLGGIHSTDRRLRRQDIPGGSDVFNLAGVYNGSTRYYYRNTMSVFSQRFMRLLFECRARLSPVQKKPVKSHFMPWHIAED